MRTIKADGRQFEVIVASDVVRDGLGVEVHELIGDNDRRMVFEIFRFDDPDSLEVKPLRTVVTHASHEVPLTVAAQACAVAKAELRPTSS